VLSLAPLIAALPEGIDHISCKQAQAGFIAADAQFRALVSQVPQLVPTYAAKADASQASWQLGNAHIFINSKIGNYAISAAGMGTVLNAIYDGCKAGGDTHNDELRDWSCVEGNHLVGFAYLNGGNVGLVLTIIRSCPHLGFVNAYNRICIIGFFVLVAIL